MCFDKLNGNKESEEGGGTLVEQIQNTLESEYGEHAKCIAQFIPNIEALKRYSAELKEKVRLWNGSDF